MLKRMCGYKLWGEIGGAKHKARMQNMGTVRIPKAMCGYRSCAEVGGRNIKHVCKTFEKYQYRKQCVDTGQMRKAGGAKKS